MSTEFTPPDIMGRLAMDAPRHSFHIQMLNGDDLVLVNKPGGEFVQEIGAGIRDFSVQLGNTPTLFVPAPEAFFTVSSKPGIKFGKKSQTKMAGKLVKLVACCLSPLWDSGTIASHKYN